MQGLFYILSKVMLAQVRLTHKGIPNFLELYDLFTIFKDFLSIL